MNDKIVIITGANSGIGKAAAIKFAQEGYNVIMACRDLDRSKIVQSEIIEITKNSNIDLLELDVSSFDSIRHFCVEFKEKYKKLDILIHNAGYFGHGEKNYQISPDNIELSFATNAIGPFLMTELLADILERSDDARVLNACTTNIRHFFDPKRKIDFDNLQGELIDSKPYNGYKMYGDSKMALLMLTFKMAEKYKKEGIKVNAIQIPAIKMSKDTMRKFKTVWRIAAIIQNTFSAPPENMANTYYHICTSDEYKDISGKIINDKMDIMQPSHYNGGIKQIIDKRVYPQYAENEVNINKVWDLAGRLIKTNI